LGRFLLVSFFKIKEYTCTPPWSSLELLNGEINLNSRLLSTKCWARVVESTSHQHIIIMMGGWMMGGHKKTLFHSLWFPD